MLPLYIRCTISEGSNRPLNNWKSGRCPFSWTKWGKVESLRDPLPTQPQYNSMILYILLSELSITRHRTSFFKSKHLLNKYKIIVFTVYYSCCRLLDHWYIWCFSKYYKKKQNETEIEPRLHLWMCMKTSVIAFSSKCTSVRSSKI